MTVDSDAEHRLVVHALNRTAWRLCDRAFEPSDADSVVAYIELRRTGEYEVAWVRGGGGVQTFATLKEILDAAMEHGRAVAPRSGRRPNPIPARPPLRRRARGAR